MTSTAIVYIYMATAVLQLNVPAGTAMRWSHEIFFSSVLYRYSYLNIVFAPSVCIATGSGQIVDFCLNTSNLNVFEECRGIFSFFPPYTYTARLPAAAAGAFSKMSVQQQRQLVFLSLPAFDMTINYYISLLLSSSPSINFSFAGFSAPSYRRSADQILAVNSSPKVSFFRFPSYLSQLSLKSQKKEREGKEEKKHFLPMVEGIHSLTCTHTRIFPQTIYFWFYLAMLKCRYEYIQQYIDLCMAIEDKYSL